MIRAWAGAALLVALLGGAARADGERRVALAIRGAPPDATAAEVLARIRGELRAARFDIDVAAPGEDAPRQVVEAEARRPGVAAAMGIFFDAAEPEVWVADARSGRTSVELLMDPAGGEQRPSVLAAKAVDLLRAVLAEVPLAERPAPVPATPPPVPVVTSPQSPPLAPHRWILLAGGAWVRAGGAQTLAPSVSFAWLGTRLGGRVLVAGTGTSTDKAALAGSARVGQHLALAELLTCWRPAGSLRACLAAGAGGELLAVRGMGAPGFEGSNQTVWSGLVAAGGSVIWTPRRWIALGADARAVGAWPATAVRIDGVSVVRAGGPGVALTAGVGANL